MEKRRLSAGLQSFLAWHNLCLVMTVYSLLTLTESLARINCVHDFSPCVLTLRNRCKLQHLLWSNSIFSSGLRWSVHAWNPYPASSKHQSDQRDYQINATFRKLCLHANNMSGMSFNCSQGTMDSLQRVAGQLPATFLSLRYIFSYFWRLLTGNALPLMNLICDGLPVITSLMIVCGALWWRQRV